MDAYRRNQIHTQVWRGIGTAVLVASGFGVSLSASAAESSSKPAEIVERAKKSVAYVSGKYGSGTGFLVLPNVVATNSHVIRDEVIDEVSVRFLSSSGVEQATIKPRLLFEDKARDLALLLIPSQSDRPPLTISTDFEPGANRPVFVLGNPAQGGGVTRVNAVGKGTAEDVVMISGCPFYELKISTSKDVIDVGPGTSGGPVFDSAGRVIGILTAGFMDKKGKPTGKFFCVPCIALSPRVNEFRDSSQHEKQIRMATARHALDLAAINLHLGSQVAKLVVDARVEAAKYVSRQNQTRHRDTDMQLIAALSQFDQQVRIMSGPSLRIALDGPELTASRRRELIEFRDFVTQATNYARQARLTPGEHKRCIHVLDQADRAFQKLKINAGLTDEVIHDMTVARLNAVKSMLHR